MTITCDRCGRPFNRHCDVRRHLARKVQCTPLVVPASKATDLPIDISTNTLASTLAVWSPHAAVRLPSTESLQAMFALASLSAYCARPPAQRADEKSALGPLVTIILGTLRITHKDNQMRNLAFVDGHLYTYSDGWREANVEDVTETIIDAAAAEIWHHINSSPREFSLAVRCAASTAVLSIHNASEAFRKQLCAQVGGALRTSTAKLGISSELREATPVTLAPRVHALVTAPPTQAPRMARAPVAQRMPLHALTAERAAELYMRLGPDADALSAAAAAAVGVPDDKKLRERLEQKLWEASADGLVRDNEELRKKLIM